MMIALAASALQRGAVLLPARAVRPAVRACTVAAGDGDGGHRISLTLNGQHDMQGLGARLAEVARAGDAILLHGDYGAGKTCLARGFLRRWYSDPTEQVTSPSYLIDNAYDDPEGLALLPGVTVHHMDLWRLPEGKIRELVDLPRVFSECVSLIEWPQRLGGELTPAAHLDVHLAILEPTAAQREAAEEGGRARAAPSADEEDGYDDDEELPRVATLTARGEAWERRLADLVDERHEGDREL